MLVLNRQRIYGKTEGNLDGGQDQDKGSKEWTLHCATGSREKMDPVFLLCTIFVSDVEVKLPVIECLKCECLRNTNSRFSKVYHKFHML